MNEYQVTYTTSAHGSVKVRAESREAAEADVIGSLPELPGEVYSSEVDTHVVDLGPVEPPRRFVCGNSGEVYDESDLLPAENLLERLDFNGPFTRYECPECGALAYLIEEDS